MDTQSETDFAAFVAARSPSLLRAAYLLTGDRHLAEDLVQTALAKTYAHWNKLRRDDSFEAYVRTTIVRTNISSSRRRRIREVSSEADQHVAAPLVEGSEHSVAERDEVWQLLKTLPVRQRTVLVLRFYEDLSEQQIAVRMGCSNGTVKSQASRALATLRRNSTDHHGATSLEQR